MKVKVQVDTQTFVRFWLVVIGFLLAGVMIYSARDGLIILGTAFFLALALNGPVSRLAKYLPGRSRIGSTAIAYLLVVVFLGAFLFLAVPPIVEQTAKFVQTVPGLVDKTTKSWHALDNAIDTYHLRPQVDQALNTIKDNATKWASNVGTNLISGIGSVFGFLTSLFLVLVLSFLMLVEGPEWMKRLWALYRDKRRMEHHRKTLTRMGNVVSGYVTGQLTVSALDGFFAGVMVFIVSLFIHEVPSNLAVATAALMFIFSMIPMFGALIGSVLVGLLLVFNSPLAAIIFLVYFVIYQQLENNLISPAIQSKRLELSPLLVLAAVTVGIYVFGIAGAIISIPVAGCLRVLVEEWMEHAKRVREENDKPLHKKLVKKFRETSEEV